jgi:hypothetical protein
VIHWVVIQAWVHLELEYPNYGRSEEDGKDKFCKNSYCNLSSTFSTTLDSGTPYVETY